MEKTNIVNMDQPMTLFGSKTPKTVIYKSESHKLHQAFTVKQGEIIEFLYHLLKKVKSKYMPMEKYSWALQ